MVAEEQYVYYFDPPTSDEVVNRLNDSSKNIERKLQGAKEINMPPIFQAGPRRYGDKELKINLCKKCNNRHTIHFMSLFCPFCRYRDPRLHYDQMIEAAKIDANLYEEHSDTDIDILEKNLLDDYHIANSLVSIISAFETYCKAKYVAKVAGNSSESEVLDLIKNSFQNLTKADKLLAEFDIDIKSVIDTDLSFLQVYFEKRHVVVHNSRIIDQKFIDNTKGEQNSFGQKLVFHKSEIWILIHELEKIVTEIEDKLK